MTRKGWKLLITAKAMGCVAVNKDVFYSLTPWYRIPYTVGKWARPDKGFGPLCVFKDRVSALAFAVSMALLQDSSCLAECEYQPTPVDSIWIKSPAGDVIERRWTESLPEGTALASGVKISQPRTLKEINEEANSHT